MNNLGPTLSNLGRHEEALAATGEAVDLYRELAAWWPDVYQDALEGSLDLLHQIEQE